MKKTNTHLSEEELNCLIERRGEISFHSTDKRTGEKEVELIVAGINSIIKEEDAVANSLKNLITINKDETGEPLINLIKQSKHVLFINNDSVDRKKFQSPKLIGSVLVIPGPLPNELRHRPII